MDKTPVIITFKTRKSLLLEKAYQKNNNNRLVNHRRKMVVAESLCQHLTKNQGAVSDHDGSKAGMSAGHTAA